MMIKFDTEVEFTMCYAHIYIHTYIYIYTVICIHTHTHTHTHIYIYTHTYLVFSLYDNNSRRKDTNDNCTNYPILQIKVIAGKWTVIQTYTKAPESML